MKQKIININFTYDDDRIVATYPLKIKIPDNLTEEQEELIILNEINNVHELKEMIEEKMIKSFEELMSKL